MIFGLISTNAHFSPKNSLNLTYKKNKIKPSLLKKMILNFASSSSQFASSSAVLKINENSNLGFCLSAPVLMYHHIEPWSEAKILGQTSLAVDDNTFAEQMNYLNIHGYTTLFADDLISALINKTAIPPKNIILTFDDGYQDIYDYAFPIAKKYNLKFNLMIPTGLLGVSSGTNTYLTWNELSEMVSSGLVKVYNHTWSHYPLGLGNETKDQFEIMTAQNQISQHLGSLPNILAYPYGSGASSLLVHSLLRADGIVAAFSTIPGVYQCTTYIYALRRTRIGNVPFPAFGIN